MRLTVWCDRLVLGGLVSLTVLTPLAFGGVHPRTATVLVVGVCALGLLGAAKVVLAGAPADGWPALPRTVWVPIGLVLGLGLLQLVPLPPRVLGALSPAAFAVYERSLPGWPAEPPYARLPAVPAGGAASWRILPTPAEVRTRAPALVPDADEPGRIAGPWRPLALAPAATRTALALAAGHVALFLLVVLYPWNRGAGGERRTERTLLRALVLTAVAVALIGILQRLAWNGRILWIFVPFDWGGVPDPRPRTCGPFVNRNHFAGYLAVLFPTVLAGALHATKLDGPAPWRSRLALRAGAAVIGLGVLLSLSRGGWAALLAGAATFLALAPPTARAEDAPAYRPRRGLALAGALALLACVAGVALPGGARDVDARLARTLDDTASWSVRVGLWRDTLALAREAPFLGVGLGAWGDAFPRFDRRSYDGTAPVAAHNDYLELLAELGAVGLVLALAALVAAIRCLRSSLARRSATGRPLAAATLAGLAAVAVHALVEFDLQIPAIAAACALLLALALRPTLPRAPAGTRARGAAAAGALCGLAGLALTIAPSWSGPPPSTAAALARIDAYPARARHHRELARLLDAPATARWRRRELEIAHWLAPRDPRALDMLAASRAAAGDRAGALRALARSMEVAPARVHHAYLSDGLLPWLAADEAAAVARGLRRALARDDPVAPWTLAVVHRARGDAAAAAGVLARAARRAPQASERYRLLLAAGIDHAAAGKHDDAGRALGAASRLRPSATAPYAWLIFPVLATPERLAEGRALARAGSARGADAAELWFAVAEAAKRAGDRDGRRDALERTIALRPALAKAHFELGILWLEQRRAGRAALALRRAAELAPASAAYWYHLARAEHARHDAGRARRALEQALAIAPDHPDARALLASVMGSIG